MKILLAGATGAIGAPLIRQLVASGHEVVGITRRPEAAGPLGSLGAQAVVADALDRDGLLRALDGTAADVVVHQLTALKKMPTKHAHMAMTDELRTRGTSNLLDAARAVGASRFVTQSMIFGYGYHDFGDTLITEDMPFAPRGKGEFEKHLAAFRFNEEHVLHADGIAGVALRYGLFYGPGAGLDELIDMLRRRALPVARGGGGTVSFVHIDDAATATVAAIERGQPGQAYNVVDDRPVSWSEFLGTAAETFGARPPMVVPVFVIRAIPYAGAAMLASHRVSNEKAKRELGWAPAFPAIDDGLAQAAQTLARAAGSGSAD